MKGERRLLSVGSTATCASKTGKRYILGNGGDVAVSIASDGSFQATERPATNRYSSSSKGSSSMYEGFNSTIREEPPPYTSPVRQRYESFENPLGGNGSTSFESGDEERVSSGNSQFGTALYDFTVGGDVEGVCIELYCEVSFTASSTSSVEIKMSYHAFDLTHDFVDLLVNNYLLSPNLQLSLTAGEDVEIDYEVDGWFYPSTLAAHPHPSPSLRRPRCSSPSPSRPSSIHSITVFITPDASNLANPYRQTTPSARRPLPTVTQPPATLAARRPASGDPRRLSPVSGDLSGTLLAAVSVICCCFCGLICSCLANTWSNLYSTLLFRLISCAGVLVFLLLLFLFTGNRDILMFVAASVLLA
ncbi:hypothetical protein RHGRI_000911 [Rhododendron griersonianum]|uniref:Transmembrane protein n=1 Tax=Rhododendron griersonianum TaxID=479676 RepID=A0AAV6LJE0_9ERIC|nr:hypothetical protein RHGRI_000911 [Rhododendron griersonianum]